MPRHAHFLRLLHLLNVRLPSLLIVGLTALLPLAAATAPTPDQVLVVYNASWPADTIGLGTNDSQQVAEYFAARRGIPAANLLGVACSTGSNYYYYTGQWPTFVTEVMDPIKAALQTMPRITVICLCYGVPYTVYNPAGSTTYSIDNILMGVNAWSADGSNLGWNQNPYFDPTPGFDTSPGHFDPSAVSFLSTPMYLVTRLDGPGGAAGAMELVDQAVYADQYASLQPGGYQGGIYIDSRDGQTATGAPYTDAYLLAQPAVQSGDYSTYGSADQCIAFAEHAAFASGLPVHWENTTGAIQIGQAGATYSDGSSAVTAPQALLYGGWYNYGTYHDVWGWLPGSVACDLNSDSLDQSSLRSPNSGCFGVSALARGASCVCGVLSEPYLTGHQRPNVLLFYILAGYSFAEAAALATPTIGWQPVAIGDPLYAPFRSKSLSLDTAAPQLDAGFPQVVVGASATERIIQLVVAQPPTQPEVAQASVLYGLTSAYGTTASSGEGFWRRPSVTLSGLTAGSTYHYQVMLTDPVGNHSTSPDQILIIPASPGTSPQITTAALAVPAIVSDGSCAFSVLGSDAAGASALTYSWSVLGWSPAPMAVTPNGTLAASQATAIFSVIGSYRVRVTVTNPSGLTATSDVTVTVNGVGVHGGTVGTGTGSGSATSTGAGTAGTAGTNAGSSSSSHGCGLGGGIGVVLVLAWRTVARRRRHLPTSDR